MVTFTAELFSAKVRYSVRFLDEATAAAIIHQALASDRAEPAILDRQRRDEPVAHVRPSHTAPGA